MELELKQWFVNKNRLGFTFVCGEIERETEKAILFNGTAVIKPSSKCCKCGRELTDPVSVELGVGPVCAELDQRNLWTKEQKDAYVKLFSSKHPIKTWIPKSVINGDLPKLETENEKTFAIEAIIHKEYVLVKSKYEHADLCRSIPDGKWHKEKKFWYYPLSESTCKNVVDTFKYLDADISEDILALAKKLDKIQETKFSNDLPDIPITKHKPWLHQKQCFWFAKELSGAGLLFCMGGGKSKSLIDLIINSEDKKVLILCPDKVVRVWPKEFEKHSNGEFVVVPCEKQGKRISVKEKMEIAKAAYEENEKVVIVVNYESAWRSPMGDFINSVSWSRISLDESHRVKQHDGKLGKFVGELEAERKNILTGTLLSHGPADVFSQYRFLDPSIFGRNFYKFRNKYCIMGGYKRKQIIGYQNQDEMHEKIYSVAFRVSKDALDLPQEQHIVRDFELSASAEKYYRQADSELGIMLGEDIVRTDIVVTQLLRMQQITSGYLPVMREYYDENDMLRKELDRIEKIDSGKAELLMELLEDIDEPVIVFCRFKHDLDEIKSVAEKLDRTYGEISGRSKTALSDKAELQNGIQIAGVQIQAGGVGIDLSKSRYGIYYSVGYSLGDYEQSLARIHRPGQTKPVIYYHLVAANTVDESVYSNLSAKKNVVKSIMEARNE